MHFVCVVLVIKANALIGIFMSYAKQEVDLCLEIGATACYIQVLQHKLRNELRSLARVFCWRSGKQIKTHKRLK